MVPGTMPSRHDPGDGGKGLRVRYEAAEVCAGALGGGGRGGGLVCKRADDGEPQPGQREARALESAMTPRRMEIAGTTVNTAAETAVRLSSCELSPSFLARLQASTMNLSDMAMTKTITTATRQYHKSVVWIEQV